jgi:hypothetical protein
MMGKGTIPKQLQVCFAVSLAVCGLVLLSACSQPAQPTQANQSPQSLQTVKWDASWSRLYHDLGSLKRASDLAVVGSITGISRVITDSKGIVSTLFIFSSNRVVWNPHHLAQHATFIINQTGGIVHNVLYEIGDDPLFQVGEQAVLFLHQYKPGYFYVQGGPSGRFTIQNGMVKPINDEGVVFSTSLSVANFLTKIQNA